MLDAGGSACQLKNVNWVRGTDPHTRQLSGGNPQPRNLDPEPEPLHPNPLTLNPKPYILNPKPQTLNPQPQTQILKPEPEQ